MRCQYLDHRGRQCTREQDHTGLHWIDDWEEDYAER